MPDTVFPTVAVTSPLNGAGVAGLVTLTADAADDKALSDVQFQVDNQNVAAADVRTLYGDVEYDPARGSSPRTIRALARDAGGNVTTSAGVVVTVANVSGTSRILGYSAVGNIIETGQINSINTWRYVTPNVGGVASSLSVYIGLPVSAAPNNLFQAAVSSDAGGAPLGTDCVDGRDGDCAGRVEHRFPYRDPAAEYPLLARLQHERHRRNGQCRPARPGDSGADGLAGTSVRGVAR